MEYWTVVRVGRGTHSFCIYLADAGMRDDLGVEILLVKGEQASRSQRAILKPWILVFLT